MYGRGGALNSVANGRIQREGPFENIFIQPAAGDGGGALGAALYAYHVLLNQPRRFVMEPSYSWCPAYCLGKILHMRIIRRLNIIGEFFRFLWEQKLYWMIPMMVIIVAVIIISLLGQTTTVGPFI